MPTYPGDGAPALTVPTNMALLAMMHGQDAQRQPPASEEARDATDKVDNAIKRYMNNCIVDDVWGGFGKPFEQAAPQKETNLAQMQKGGDVRNIVGDLSSAAAFVQAFLVASTGAAVVGNVTESGFQSEELRIKVDRSRNMPHTWKGIKLNRLGEQKMINMVTNDVPYT